MPKLDVVYYCQVINMEQKERKHNRLGYYDYGQKGSYFVTLCTHSRLPLFKMESIVGNCLRAVPPPPQNVIIRKWIRETQNKFPNIVIDKYVIMPDHLHIIVTIRERHAGRSLPDIMQFFKTMTTNDYIRGVKAGALVPFDKKLWQKSYYDHVIRNQQDYDETWQYIENNPSKWMLVYQKES